MTLNELEAMEERYYNSVFDKWMGEDNEEEEEEQAERFNLIGVYEDGHREVLDWSDEEDVRGWVDEGLTDEDIMAGIIRLEMEEANG